MTRDEILKHLRDLGHHCSCVDLEHIADWIFENMVLKKEDK